MKSVTVKSDGSASGTTIAADGKEIRGIRAVRFEHSAGDYPEINLDLCCATVEVAGLPVFHVTDPVSGEMKELLRVEFKDGSQWP